MLSASLPQTAINKLSLSCLEKLSAIRKHPFIKHKLLILMVLQTIACEIKRNVHNIHVKAVTVKKNSFAKIYYIKT